VETDPTRAIRWMIGLSDIVFLGCEDGADGVGRIHVETRVEQVGCPSCGVIARVKDRPRVELVDLPVSGRPICLVWHKLRWCCPDPDSTIGACATRDRWDGQRPGDRRAPLGVGPSLGRSHRSSDSPPARPWSRRGSGPRRLPRLHNQGTRCRKVRSSNESRA